MFPQVPFPLPPSLKVVTYVFYGSKHGTTEEYYRIVVENYLSRSFLTEPWEVFGLTGCEGKKSLGIKTT
jgi:hypothetical protein